MIRPKNKKVLNNDKYINTLTEIIDTYNKTNKVDMNKIEQIANNKPELLKDEIIHEIISNNN